MNKIFVIGLMLVMTSATQLFALAKETKQNIPEIVKLMGNRVENNMSLKNASMDDGSSLKTAEKSSWRWINKALALAWRPPTECTLQYLEAEIDGRDATSLEWQTNGYSICVTQTKIVFSLRITPLSETSQGADLQTKISTARDLCLNIFSREGEMWEFIPGVGGGPKIVTIPSLNEKIANYSFNERNIAESFDGKICGFPTSKDDAVSGIQNTPKEMTPHAWEFWFRDVNWWNDGKSVCFYFRKIAGKGSRVALPTYNEESDKEWFVEPKDRKGRPAKLKSKPSVKNEGSSVESVGK